MDERSTTVGDGSADFLWPGVLPTLFTTGACPEASLPQFAPWFLNPPLTRYFSLQPNSIGAVILP
jgi:hypothetical protein